jgi:hypothetical protein
MSGTHPTPQTVACWQRAQRYARYVWQQATAARRKLVRDAGLARTTGLRELHGDLLIPMRDQLGELWAIEHMPASFRPGMLLASPGFGPTYLLGARLEGLRFIVGDLSAAATLGRVIGVTVYVHDAVRWHEDTGAPVVAAFALANAAALAAELRFAYPDARVVLWSRLHEHDEGMRAAAVRAGVEAVASSEGFELLEEPR